MHRWKILGAIVAIITLPAGPCLSAMRPPALQLAQAAVLAGEWASSEPCATSTSRLRFAGNTLAFFSGAQRMSEYEVEITDASDRVSVRVVRVIVEPARPGGLAPGSALQYRRNGENLRLTGMALPGGGYMSPTVATLYRRCK
jgi:hypothetical protein